MYHRVVKKAKRSRVRRPQPEGVLAGQTRRSAPFEFVLDALTPVAPTTRLMFGCVAVYVGEQIVLILRDRKDYPADNGVWLATVVEHHASLRTEFPRMRSIGLFGREVTHWQLIPAATPDFEQAALRACRLILERDPRIGKVPKRRRVSRPRR